jgi:DNA-binding response OmpR family regulator
MNMPHSILVVEDDPNMQILLRHILNKAGYRIMISENGANAKTLLATEQFDMVCSDVMIPGLDGIQLCSWMKNQELLRDIPFVILSARAQVGEKKLGLQAHADAYITKPFLLQEVLDTVQKLLLPAEC